MCFHELSELPPEFQKAVDHLKSKGMPSGWLLKAVNPRSPTAIFLKGGRLGYLSPCPQYEGFWLSGGYGSVQCKAVEDLLPGYFWYAFCSKECSKCPHSKQ